MGTPAYVGLRTGAGASSGLQKMLERQRAEELLANQGRQVDINAFSAQQQADLQAAQLGENQRQWDTGQPGRDVATAQTGLENQALQAKLPILQGLTGQLGGGGGGIAGMDNPQGRAQLAIADITPSQIFPQDTGQEQVLNAYAQKIGKLSGRDLTYDEQMKALSGMPAAVVAQTRVQQGAESLGIRREELQMRREMHGLRMKQAEQDLINGVDPLNRQIALAAFRNRLQYEIEIQSGLSEYFSGKDPDKDPWVQIQRIAEEVKQQMGAKPQPATNNPNQGRGAGAGGAGAAGANASDLDSILAERRRKRGAGAAVTTTPGVVAPR